MSFSQKHTSVYDYLDEGQPSRSGHSRSKGKQQDLDTPPLSPKSFPSTSIHYGGKELPEPGIFDMPRGNTFHTSPSFERGRKSTKYGDIAPDRTSSYVTAPGQASYVDEPSTYSTNREDDRGPREGGSGSSGSWGGASTPGPSTTSTSRRRHHSHSHSHHHAGSSAQRPRTLNEVAAPNAYKMLHGQHVHGREPANSEFWGPRVAGTQPGRRRGKKRRKRRVEDDWCLCTVM